jgi:hypothetical protein
MSYSNYANLTRSQKIILAHLEARQRLRLFTLHSGSIYYRNVDHFVVGATHGTSTLTKAASVEAMSAGSWYYDPQAGRFYVWAIGSVNPQTVSLYVTYRFFFSNIPTEQLSDITSGELVHYDARINSIDDLKLELDYENTGIAIETNSSISLINNDRYFDPIFDTLIWENQRAKFYSWNTELTYAEAKVIYDGLVTDKTFSPASVKFSLKDQLTRLKEIVSSSRFSEDDGDLDESVIGKPKRIIFGRVDKIRTQGVNKTLDGFSLTGTCSASTTRNLLAGVANGSAGAAAVTGVGTSFIGNIHPGNTIKFVVGVTEYTYTVSTVTSNTALTLTSNLLFPLVSATIYNMASGDTSIAGTVAGTINTATVTGTSTLFTSMLAVGTKIKLVSGSNEYRHTVATVASNTSITVTPNLSVTLSGATLKVIAPENNVITGSGTSFLSECSPGDSLKVIINEEGVSYAISEIVSDTELTVGEEIDTAFTNESLVNEPERPYRLRNRRWNIAGHKLREYTTTITVKVNNTNFQVEDIGDIEPDDRLVIEGETYLVTRVSGNFIRVNQGIPTEVSSGYEVTKIPLQNVYQGPVRLIADRDYTLENNDDGATIVIDPLAEFNCTTPKALNITFTLTSGSRIVTTSATDFDLTSVLKPRDWISARSVNITGQWYEVLDVQPNKITLRTAVITSFTGNLLYKSPDYISDDSLITADCLGMDTGSLWVRYPSQVVKWILEQLGVTNINEDSFSQAEDDCSYTMALYYPESIGGELPNIRDMISDVNKSVFGSLYLNDSFEFCYSILNADRDAEPEVLKDEDIVSFQVKTKNAIINQIILEYSPFVDTNTESEGFRTIQLTSDFVDEAIGKKETLTVKSYLYREEDANRIASRWLFFRALTQSVVSVRTKLNLASKSLNDRLFLDLARLYYRYGGNDRRKIGIINAISKDGEGCEVEFNDLGNLFNRVASIAPNTAGDYDPDSSEVVSYGYIVDNDTETPDPSSEIGLGSNLIG